MSHEADFGAATTTSGTRFFFFPFPPLAHSEGVVSEGYQERRRRDNATGHPLIHSLIFAHNPGYSTNFVCSSDSLTFTSGLDHPAAATTTTWDCLLPAGSFHHHHQHSSTLLPRFCLLPPPQACLAPRTINQPLAAFATEAKTPPLPTASFFLPILIIPILSPHDK